MKALWIIAVILLGSVRVVHGASNDKGVKEAASKLGITIAQAKLIQEVSKTFNVPAGLLYGVWKKESGGLAFGWRSKKADWFRARDLTRAGGECFKRYSHKPDFRSWCKRHWRALQAICGQRYPLGPRQGERVCDANKVHTSYAHAMGPMQHMPAELVQKTSAGLWRYNPRHAMDWNRDGVVDPHDLGDAMAMTAHILRRLKNNKGSWPLAAASYFGSNKRHYYEGCWETHPRKGHLRERRGVRDHWVRWCEAFGCGKTRKKRTKKSR